MLWLGLAGGSARPLPAMPLGIAEQGGTLWVCGDDEMIASSADGGRHWVLRHWQSSGEMLFSFAFRGGQGIEAFGTAGARVVSRDGGTRWKERPYRPARGLEQVELVGKAGYGASADAIATSENGGDTWTFAGIKAGGKSRSDHYREVIQVAVRDAEHAAALMAADGQGAQAVLATADGGRHWREVGFPKAWGWTGLRADGSGYHLYGKHNGAGSGARPAAVDSSDGLVWKVAAAPPSAYRECGEQGCLMDGGWAELRGAAPRLWAEPEDADHPLRRSWAAEGASFCQVGDVLRCRRGRQAWAPPAAAAAAVPSDRLVAAHCLSCPAPRYPVSARQMHHTGVVLVQARIDASGHIQQLVLLAAPSADLARATIEGLRHWRYSPMRVGGRAVPVDTTITTGYTLGG